MKNLLTSISDDSRNAFNMFYDLYYEHVFRFSYYFIKNKEACREVVSDVFLSIWQSRKKLNDIANIETYLFVTVRNEANHYLNRSKKHSYVPLEEIPIHLEKEVDESPDEELVSQEIDTLLTEIINELPERCRTIFLMAREEGLKPKEIAEILSINESTVRVQMKIAIDKIITRIKPIFPNLSFTVLFTYLTAIRF